MEQSVLMDSVYTIQNNAVTNVELLTYSRSSRTGGAYFQCNVMDEVSGWIPKLAQTVLTGCQTKRTRAYFKIQRGDVMPALTNHDPHGRGIAKLELRVSQAN